MQVKVWLFVCLCSPLIFKSGRFPVLLHLRFRTADGFGSGNRDFRFGKSRLHGLHAGGHDFQDR